MNVFRFARAAVVAALVVVTSGCATRHAEFLIPLEKASETPIWRVTPGDVIKTKVYREPDLSGDAIVQADGNAYFPGLGRVKVEGLAIGALQDLLTKEYQKLIVDVTLDATITRDVVVYGQVRSPGIYPVDLNTTVLGVLAKAGGGLSTSLQPQISLVRANGDQVLLQREGRLSGIAVERGDAVYVLDQSFLIRNSQSFQAFTIFAGVILSVLSLIFFVSK
jgi:polysaccharide export outer membrane protein